MSAFHEWATRGSGSPPKQLNPAIDCAETMPDQPTAKFDSPLIQELRGLGYTHLKELPDGCVVGINRLLFTTALHIGLTELSWERRYCYEDPLLAVAALGALKSEDDMPLPGYVAKRGLGA